MKKLLKIIAVMLMSILICTTFAACTPTRDPADDGGGGDGGNEQPPDEEEGYTFVGNFSIKNGDGTAYNDAKYDGVFKAIDEVGMRGATGTYVVDEKDKKIFERGARSVLHMYTKSKYYGSTTNTKEVDEFLLTVPYSHVIIGTAGKYYGHSTTRMNSNVADKYGYEPESGSYVYQFSKGGYTRASAIVRLSEARYKKSQNPNIPSNIYIFFNSNGQGGACDMGVMSGDGHNGKFYAVTNGFEHPLALPFRNDAPITEMKFDEEKQEYYGADDLHMEYTTDAAGTHMILKNLRTNVVQEFSEGPSVGSPLAEKYATTWQNRTMLHATSYVPVLDKCKLWDPLNGGYFNNVVYEDVKIYKHGSTEEEDFYPSSPTTYYGFSYADDGASYSERTVNGKKQVIHNMFYTADRV